jgi:predicted secreted hydrolase
MLADMIRRDFLGVLALAGGAAPPAARAAPRALAFPHDHGAHPDSRTEWWYLTGWLQAGGGDFGFQVTFFRTRTGLGDTSRSRFAPRQLVFAHAALSDLRARRQRHDQRIARAGFDIADTAPDDTRVRLRDWSLERLAAEPAGRYQAHVASDSAGFSLDLALATTQPVLLQGDAGFSRKRAPPIDAASRYYTQPQLAVQGQLVLDGTTLPVQAGRAWLDHEWSDALLGPGAVGWDWIGMNLDDRGALTAFRVRDAAGTTLHAGGSWRQSDGRLRDFGAAEVRFTPLRHWQSPASQARYPVQWRLLTPAGEHEVAALFDAQELDSRASTGAFYWEGLSELRDTSTRRPLGRGYLEMTGYAGPLRL